MPAAPQNSASRHTAHHDTHTSRHIAHCTSHHTCHTHMVRHIIHRVTSHFPPGGTAPNVPFRHRDISYHITLIADSGSIHRAHSYVYGDTLTITRHHTSHVARFTSLIVTPHPITTHHMTPSHIIHNSTSHVMHFMARHRPRNVTLYNMTRHETEGPGRARDD